ALKWLQPDAARLPTVPIRNPEVEVQRAIRMFLDDVLAQVHAQPWPVRGGEGAIDYLRASGDRFLDIGLHEVVKTLLHLEVGDCESQLDGDGGADRTIGVVRGNGAAVG